MIQQNAVQKIGNTLLELHHSGAVHVLNHHTLVIADLHIGKAAHFRKNGIPIPSMANRNNFWKLVEAIEWARPNQIVFLGDISHSEINEEWTDFVDFLDQFPEIKRILVKGNHDIFKQEIYVKSGFEVVQALEMAGIYWIHEPEEIEDKYTIAGHVHPAVRMTGSARQSLRLPCFYFGKTFGILPAFGEFTGTGLIKPKKNDAVWGIVKNKVIALNK